MIALFFSEELRQHQIHILSNKEDKRNEQIIATFRKELKQKLDILHGQNSVKYNEEMIGEELDLHDIIALSDEMDVNEETEQAVQMKPKSNFKFCFTTFPSDIDFDVVSVDAQHTLWESPGIKTGKDYVNFIGRRHWDYFFKKLNVSTVYWNYDLYSLVKKKIPKTEEQEKRDQRKSEESESYNDHHLLKDSSVIISDNTITSNWRLIMNNRECRNTIANYVGSSAHFYHMEEGKHLIINSEYNKNEEKVIPQEFTKNQGKTLRIPRIDRENDFCEGEGAAFAPLNRFHTDENCLVISNDSDALMYGLLCGSSRTRSKQDGKFKTELWVQLNHTQQKTGICGSKNNKISEFWNINNLIYGIEETFKDEKLLQAVLGTVIIYLAGGSDFTEKWYQKTHRSFLEAWIRSNSYVGDLVVKEEEAFKVNLAAYRRLVHAVWSSKTVTADSCSFEELRKMTRKRKNLRLHLPDEELILQVGKRIAGVFQYMTSYIKYSTTNIDWTMYGFYYDTDSNSFKSQIFPENYQENHSSKKDLIMASTESEKVTNTDTNKTEEKSKRKVFSKQELDIMETAFQSQVFASSDMLKELSQVTGATTKTVRRWFSRRRKLAGKENAAPEDNCSKKFKAEE